MANISDNYQLLQDRIAVLQYQRDFLLGEMKVAAKAFSHHGLEGHAWCANQAIEMAGGNHEEPN